MFAAMISLSWLRQKLVVPVQFERPSTGCQGPLSWPPLEVNHWNTLTLTRWLVRLKDGRGPNRPPTGCAGSPVGTQPNRRIVKTKRKQPLPGGQSVTQRGTVFTVPMIHDTRLKTEVKAECGMLLHCSTPKMPRIRSRCLLLRCVIPPQGRC